MEFSLSVSLISWPPHRALIPPGVVTDWGRKGNAGSLPPCARTHTHTQIQSKAGDVLDDKFFIMVISYTAQGPIPLRCPVCLLPLHPCSCTDLKLSTCAFSVFLTSSRNDHIPPLPRALFTLCHRLRFGDRNQPTGLCKHQAGLLPG